MTGILGDGAATRHDAARVDDSALTLIEAVQRLSLARTAGEVQEIVRTTARALCGADGATLVLRDGDQSWYVDEDAVEPLWKGQRFPLDSCLGGWVIRHREALIVPDVQRDERVPFHIYEPTFVRSLVLVPIRATDPVGAIGNYWSTTRTASASEVALLQALADATAVALENVSLWQATERRVAERTAGLKTALDQSEEILGTLAHELRNAVGSASGLLDLVLTTSALEAEVHEDLRLAHQSTVDALRIVDQQLALARERAGALQPGHEVVVIPELLDKLARTYRAVRRNDAVELLVESTPGASLVVRTDRHLLLQVLRNLVSNALKFTDRGAVRLSAAATADGGVELTVRDSGVGIDAEDLDRIFGRFEQVEDAQAGRPIGTGLGLPYVRRVVEILGGALHLESQPGLGSTFRVELPAGGPA